MYTTDGCVHCTREMKKKILVWLMGFGLVLGLCACGQEKKTVSVSRSVLKAYTEYYNNFFGEHYLDCGL